MDPAESPQDQRETVAMPPAGQPAEAVLWPRRHPWLTGLGLLALAIAILILLVSAVQFGGDYAVRRLKAR